MHPSQHSKVSAALLRMTMTSSAVLLACEPAREAPRVELSLRSDASEIETVTTDLDYDITLSEARLVVRDFEFTTAGELHAATLPRRVWDLLVSPAWAHPGHYEGGETIGEARGHFVVDWLGQANVELGIATLIVGGYTSVNFTFALGEEDDGLDEGDPLFGHTAHFVGVASKGDQTIDFDLLVASPEDRVLVGVPFEAEITEDSQDPVGFALLPQAELGGGTLFDGLDFSALDLDDDGHVELAPGADEGAALDAYNLLRRTLQTHDHYGFRLLQAEGEQ